MRRGARAAQYAAMAFRPGDIQIRPAEPEDLDFAWDLYRRLMKPLAEELITWSNEGQKAVVAPEILGGRASIILLAGRHAGWCHVREGPEVVELCQLHLLPELQNLGIGSLLLARLIENTRRRGKTLTLKVMKNNRARALYERLGFVQTGESDFKIEMTWRGDGPV